MGDKRVCRLHVGHFGDLLKFMRKIQKDSHSHRAEVGGGWTRKDSFIKSLPYFYPQTDDGWETWIIFSQKETIPLKQEKMTLSGQNL